ncbi:MAG: UDP-3-O-[3-hydroxymyristoyl] glucosamine N-acyltransferase [Myxococcota bacterium]|jgi:UDP-3-O-[3-hydroxymyristoyl] glucosamine N-acyltransferase
MNKIALFFPSILVGLASVANAADLDANGCDDAIEAVNDACVDPSATVDPSASIAAHASIGADVSIGAGATIAPRARIQGASGVTTSIGDNVLVGRTTQIGAGAVIGEDATLGRNVVVATNLDAAFGSSVGYASTLGNDVTLGSNSVVGNLVALGDYTTLGSSAVLARGVQVASGADASTGTTILGVVGPETYIGWGSTVSVTARIRKLTTIGNNVDIGAGVRVARGATIHADVTLESNVRIGANAVVFSGETVTANTIVGRDETVGTDTLRLVLTSGVYSYSNGTGAASCELYRRPTDSGHTYDNEPSGLYLLDTDGNGLATPYTAYCDMTTEGGGWTRIVSTTGNAEDFGQNTSAIVSSYAVVSSTNGVFEAFRSVKAFSDVLLFQTSGAQEGAYAAYDLEENISGRSVMDILQEDCRPASCSSNNDSVHDGARVQRPVSSNAYGAWTSAYSGLRSAGGLTISSGPASHFFMCGVNESSDNDQSVLAFSNATGSVNSWGDSWRRATQSGTAWSFWNGDYHSCPTTAHIGNGYHQGHAGYKTEAGSYSVYIR